MMTKIKGLYAIVGHDTDNIVWQVSELVKGGASIIQYRDKKSAYPLLLKNAKAIKKICQANNVVFIINDSVNLCLDADADGVHLGKDDDMIKEARLKLGSNKIIGASCYNSYKNITDNIKLYADYIALGSFFPSPTKPNAKQVKITEINKAQSVTKLPIVAIGGITLATAKILIQEKISSIAVISALYINNNLQSNAKSFSKLF